MEPHDQEERLVGALHEDDDERQERDGQHADHEGVGHEGPPREHEDEGEEIDRQGNHPEQRDGLDVGRDERGHAQHEARGDQGQQHPAQAPARGEAGQTLPGRIGERGHGGAPEEHRTRESEYEQQQVAPGPEPALLRESEPGLEQDRIAEQPEHAPQVAGRVEEVGIARRRVPRACEPLLEERARRRDHEEGKPDGDREQCE